MVRFRLMQRIKEILLHLGLNSTMVRFRLGVGWTWIRYYLRVSIPLWFDLDSRLEKFVERFGFVSIPLWFDLDKMDADFIKKLDQLVSIPLWFDLDMFNLIDAANIAKAVSIPLWFDLDVS